MTTDETWVHVDPETAERAGAEQESRIYSAMVADELRRLRVREEAKRQLRAEETARPDGAPRLTLLSDFLSVPDDPATYRIDRLWPTGGRVMLAAQFKAGKTTMIGNLLRSLADGDPYLGEYAITPPDGRVVLIDDELDERMLRRWLRDHGIRNTDRIAVVSLRGRTSDFDILDGHTRRRWADELNAVNASVVILDCLRPVLDSLGLDESTDAGELLVKFDELLTLAGASDGLIVHHMGHAGERARGSSRLRDWPDVEWRLVRQDDDPASPRYFSAYGRDVDVPESALHYEADTRRLVLAGTGDRKQAAGRKSVPAVLALLGEHPDGLSGNQIELRLPDEPQKAVREALKAVRADGRVTATRGARNATIYRLSDTSTSVRQSSSPVRQRGRSEFVSSSIGDELNSLPDDQADSHLVADELNCFPAGEAA
jgi:hypothetical protein